MKKQIITLLILAIIGVCTQCATAQNTPIATKSFGVDSVSGLNKNLVVYGININTDMQRIEVLYKIVLVSTTGTQFEVSRASFIRDNSTNAGNFNVLRNSSLGQGLSYSVLQDIGKIQSFETLITDLQQK